MRLHPFLPISGTGNPHMQWFLYHPLWLQQIKGAERYSQTLHCNHSSTHVKTATHTIKQTILQLLTT